MNISGVTKYFATASEVYTNNLSASISAGAVTVPVNANNDYADGDIVVLTVEPGTTNEATFTGEKASTPARFVNCVWTEGNTGVGHASGVTITDYDSATHFSMLSKGVQQHANQDGSLKTAAVQAALNIADAVPSDYTSLAQTATTITQNGNRSQTLTFPAVDYTDRLSPGMRIRTARSTAAPNQSANLDGVNDYFSKTAPAGMTFTDDFVVGGWIKIPSYDTGEIISRFNGTNGWRLNLVADGRLQVIAYNGSASNYSLIVTHQSIPLNKWTHVAIQLDMSSFTATPTTSYVMIDGEDTAALVSRSGTNPTSLIQAGNLEIGAINGSTPFFPGKIAQAFVFNSKQTQATMRGYMSQGLLGTETGLISAFTLSNSLTDLNTTNANNLTANGGVLTTNADSPFGGQADGTISTTIDYGIIQTITKPGVDTIVTVQTPEGCTIPTSGGVASISYSQFKAPYGFPSDPGKWNLVTAMRVNQTLGIAGSGLWSSSLIYLKVPVGFWKVGYQGMYSISSSSVAIRSGFVQMNDAAPTSSVYNTTVLITRLFNNVGTNNVLVTDYKADFKKITSAATFKLYGANDAVAGTETWAIRGDQSISVMFAENALL